MTICKSPYHTYNNVQLTMSIWSIAGPLDKHEDDHVEEQ